MKIRNLLTAAVAAVAMCSCAVSPDSAPVAEEVVERVIVMPELDYSNESPDCKTAGARIAEHIEIGMTLDDVRRLVGNPRWNFPGQWWWSAAFSEKGRPVIKFPFGRGDGDVVVTGLSSDITNCAS